MDKRTYIIQVDVISDRDYCDSLHSRRPDKDNSKKREPRQKTVWPYIKNDYRYITILFIISVNYYGIIGCVSTIIGSHSFILPSSEEIRCTRDSIKVLPKVKRF